LGRIGGGAVSKDEASVPEATGCLRPILRVVSGGQTGADRAALDAALECGIEVGGWVPKGRLAEDGVISDIYPNLKEADTQDPARRTELNIRDSDATLILSHGKLIGGSEVTKNKADETRRPCKHIDLGKTVPATRDCITQPQLTREELAAEQSAITEIEEWLSAVKPRVLNVAGPRASEDPGIYDATKRIMEGIFMNQDLEVLLNLRESVLAQCGRWDQIRWQVPSWFCTLGTVCIGFLTQRKDQPYDTTIAKLFFIALATFGSLSFLLLLKLVLYERRVVREYNEYLVKFPVGDRLMKALRIERPFSFDLRLICRTATFWFLVYTLLLVGVFVVFAVKA
jgi:Circularly permutated YpsA SLOG family